MCSVCSDTIRCTYNGRLRISIYICIYTENIQAYPNSRSCADITYTGQRLRCYTLSLVPSGGGKMARYNLFAHPQKSGSFRFLIVFFRYFPAYVQRRLESQMIADAVVSKQTLYKTRVDALCTCTYVAMLHWSATSKLVYFSGYLFRLPDT